MNATYTPLKLIFLGLFVLALGAVLIYHLFWVWPAQQCEQAGKWWDSEGRVCAQPVLISDITGRTIQDKQAETAAKAAIEASAKASKGQAPAPAAR